MPSETLSSVSSSRLDAAEADEWPALYAVAIDQLLSEKQEQHQHASAGVCKKTSLWKFTTHGLACQFQPCAVNFHKICPRTEHTQQERECKPEDKRHNTNSIHTYRCRGLVPLPAWSCQMPACRFPRYSATRTRTRTRKHLSGHTQAPSIYTCMCKDKCTP